jgi:molybdopterin-containing oxidoreductase family iron-sulfur binding subunit
MSVTDSVKARFASEPPARFWRSLGELSGTPSFRVQLSREFPDIAARFGAATDRRTALKLLGASLLMAGVAACKAPEGIAPYVQQPEATIPGRPRFFATAMPLDGYGMGVLAESHEGRPTKIEGNPLHPASLGGTDPIMQASVWSLYDPSRSRTVLQGSETSTWDAALGAIAALRAEALGNGGRRLGLVIGPETSPTLRRQLTALRAEMPELKVYRHAPLESTARKEAALAAFGQDLLPIYDLAAAQTIVTLGGDFLGDGPGRLAHARAFVDGRRVRRERRQMNRLYSIESAPTLTGSNADWSRRVRPSGMDGIATQLLAAVEDGTAADTELQPLVRDLTAGRGLVIAGPNESQFVQAVAHRLNGVLGAPVRYIAPPGIDGDGDARTLVGDIEAGRTDTLVVLGPDLVHSAPGDLDMAGALRRLKLLLHWGLHRDATAALAHWHVPATHYLEAWSDVLAYDGTPSLLQPLIEPLYQGRTAHEMLAALGGDDTTPAHDLVRATWRTLDDHSWMAALKSGVLPPVPAVPLQLEAKRPEPPSPAAAAGLELKLVPDAYFRDGAWAANLRLMELPRPLSKLVWGNAAEMSAATASRLGVSDGDQVALSTGGKAITLPAFVLPGMPDDTIAVALGWGRQIGDGAAVGANAFALTGPHGPLQATRTGSTADLITTQEFHSMEGRDLLREVELAAWPGPGPEPIEQPTVLPEWQNPDEAWGMSIDLTACIGCMACVSACAAENNSPVVGPDEVARGHDMHWLRVDRYYSGDAAAPETSFQPVPCMQCEDAPCEVVCPVTATITTHDGINAQVYNRCVGTRYCSQNCPYKVRRFNFFDYNKEITPDSPLSLLMNPDVTVRERGVMEKCTYCMQRIAEVRIGNETTSDAPIADGAVLTACQQACPTRAITFGNIKDKESKVAAEKAEPSSYAMLAELGTRPRTTYLAKVRNRPDGKEGGNG